MFCLPDFRPVRRLLTACAYFSPDFQASLLKRLPSHLTPFATRVSYLAELEIVYR